MPKGPGMDYGLLVSPTFIGTDDDEFHGVGDLGHRDEWDGYLIER